MSTIEKFISPLVQSQFPDFFKDQGPLFILFVEEYYKWLESNDADFSSYSDSIANGNPLYHARRLLEYKDVDFTLDEFIVYLKEKYLKDVPINTNISNRRLIKAAHDLFAAKGSQRSFDLFFKMVFGTKVEIYVPGEDILKPSDGTWVLPRYLELTRSNRTVSYVGKMITGQISGATAFIEYLVTRNINGKLIDIVYLSNLTGNFETGEIIADDGIVASAPKIIGSLSTIDITTTGELFEIGEIVKITSARGVEGFARVSQVQSITGLVRFTIVDGGWGYSTTAETTVAEKTIALSNITNSNAEITELSRFEIVTQNLYNFSLTNVTGAISNNALIINNDVGANTSASISVTISQNTETLFSSNSANIILNQINANVFSNTVVYEKNRSIIVTNTSVAFTLDDSLVQRTGSTNNVVGRVSSVSNVIIITANTATIGSNGIHTGTYIEQSTSNANGYVYAITREQLTSPTTVNNFSVVLANGTFNNTDVITIYEDSTKATSLGTFYPFVVQNGYQYLLSNTNLVSNTRWSYNNTAIKITDPSVNTNIIIATDIGGIVTGNTDVSATGTIIGSNSSAIGLKDVNNTFYSSGLTKIYSSSNTYANSERTFTGTGADFSIGIIEDIETVRLSPDFINANNDGPGANSVKFSEMLISGANSTFGNLNSVYIELPGTGYDNTDIIIFTGGNTGVGSYEAGNASIITDASGNIVSVSLSANTGNGIITTPSVSITNSTGGATSGSGASLVPVSSLGFIKQPGGDITFLILDLLRFNTKTIGSIVSLSNVNPGENYNVNPFVFVYDAEVAAYNKKDIILNFEGASSPGFILNEVVEQTIGAPGIEITSNNFTGGYRSVASVTVDNAGSGFTARPTVTFNSTGTNGYNVEGNTTAKIITAALGDNKGTSYRVGDTLTVDGGTFTTQATVNVTAVGTIPSQTETDVIVFEGGINFNVSDTITLNDGSVITVDAVVSNIVTEFTITSNSTSGIATNDITLTQSATSGAGSNFSITLTTDNQAAFDVAILSGGSYTSLPTLNENTPTTTGIGINATLDLDVGLNSVYITDGGVNYLTAPSVTIGGTGGSGANATAVLSSLSNFTVEEIVYSTDGITNVATGQIFSSTLDVSSNTLTTVLTSNTGTWQNTITVSVLTVDNNTSFTNGDTVTQGTASGNLINSNTSTLIVKDVTGTFQANATLITGSLGGSANISSVDSSAKVYTLIGSISRANSEIIDTDSFTASALARGVIKSIISNNEIIVERRSLFTEYLPTTGIIGAITGKTSGTSANVTGVAIYDLSLAAGDNANILASVVASEGGIQSLEIVSSGFGFEQDEGVDIISQDNLRAATGKANILNQGIGLGFYSTNKGFLDDSIKVHDGEYYQNFSYEIQTSIPFERYANVLKNVLHIAGKKMFGRLSVDSQANINMTVTSTGITTS